MPRSVRLTKEQEKQFRELWKSRVSVLDIARTLSLTRNGVGVVRKRLKLPQRTSATRAKVARSQHYVDPTPEEIAERAEAEQQKHFAARRAESPSNIYRQPGDYGIRVVQNDVFGGDV